MVLWFASSLPYCSIFECWDSIESLDPRLYQFLKYTAITLALVWVVWSIYGSFFASRMPGDTEYHAANRLFEDGEYERARVTYQKALDEDAEHIHALRGLARTLLQLGQFEAALAEFNTAIAMDTEFAGSYANRGILYDRMGQHELALADYRMALQLDPEIAEGPHWLIRFLRNQPERPPGIAERAAYLTTELQKPEAERLTTVAEIDDAQRSYKK